MVVGWGQWQALEWGHGRGGAASQPPPCTGTDGGVGVPGVGVLSEELPGSPSSGPIWAEGQLGQWEVEVTPGVQTGRIKEEG